MSVLTERGLFHGRKFSSLLVCGVSTLAFGALGVSSSAMAQDQQPDKNAAVGEVVVTGIRQSLQSAQRIKQLSDVVVDAVTAEDIGALPDRSVTEALQRVPGVAINRFAGSNDPDHFSVEGSGVVVRGLSFVRSEFNGRDTFTANNGRELSFADVSPELLQSVEVFKNTSADMIEGGVAGTVNLNTRKPFDSPGLVIAGSAEASYGDFIQKWTPTFSGLISDRWHTSIGDVGILLNAVSSRVEARSDGIQVQNYYARTDLVPGKTVYAPTGADFRSQDWDRKRQGYAAAAQWKSNDGSMLATFQFLRSDSQTAWTEHAVETATDVVTGGGVSGSTVNFGNPNTMPLPGTQYDFDSSGLFTDGVITQSSGWRSADPSVPLNGMQSQLEPRSVEQKFRTSDYGFNFSWTPTSDLKLNFDYQHVSSRVKDLDVQLMEGFWAVEKVDLRGNLPKVQFLPANATGSGDPAAYFSDPSKYFWRSAMDHIEDSNGQENAYRADGEYDLHSGWLDSVKFGARYAEREQTTRYSTYNWGVISEIWNGSTGPVWLAQNAANSHGLVDGGNLATLYPFDNFMRGQTGVPLVGPYYSANVAQNYDALAQQLKEIQSHWGSGWTPLAQRSNVIPGSPFTSAEINTTDERTTAAYGMIKFGQDGAFGTNLKVSGNLGLRYVRTDFAATGALGFPTASQVFSGSSCVTPPGGTPPAFCLLSPTEQTSLLAFATGATIPDTAKNHYDNWLPSFNLKVGFADNMLVRFAWSRNARRPDLGLTRDYFLITTNIINNQFQTQRFQANTGNPFLKPMTSTNYDLSYEWYFAKAGSFTASLFYKNLHNVMTNGFFNRSITNAGQTFDVFVTGPVNGIGVGKVKGLELAYQQFYDFLPSPLDGFGIQANYTYIESAGVLQQGLSNSGGGNSAVGGVTPPGPNVPGDRLPLEQLSKHNVNLTGIYEKGPFSARLAYSWRSRFLLTTRDVIFPFAPIFNDATGQLDGSFFFTVNPHVKVGVEGVNLLNEVTKTSQVLTKPGGYGPSDPLIIAPRSWFMNDRRFTFSIRANY